MKVVCLFEGYYIRHSVANQANLLALSELKWLLEATAALCVGAQWFIRSRNILYPTLHNTLLKTIVRQNKTDRDVNLYLLFAVCNISGSLFFTCLFIAFTFYILLHASSNHKPQNTLFPSLLGFPVLFPVHLSGSKPSCQIDVFFCLFAFLKKSSWIELSWAQFILR